VVIHDVPPGGIAVGVPAKIRLRPADAPFDAQIDDPAIYI
jgi:serine O-acetyltransferase